MAGKSITRKQMVDLRNILENHLIPFVNIVNECCEVFEGEYEDYIGEWFFTPNSGLGEKMPIELMGTEKGQSKVLELLRFIEIDEADLI
jgi:uncharacterized protein (DUF2384 family)